MYAERQTISPPKTKAAREFTVAVKPHARQFLTKMTVPSALLGNNGSVRGVLFHPNKIFNIAVSKFLATPVFIGELQK